MGAYTANYMLYLCAAGEQGWGDAINGNFEKIDTKLKSNTEAAADAATRAEWEKISGKPNVYPPSTHTHPLNQITDRPQMIKLSSRMVSLPVTTLPNSGSAYIPINGFVVSPISIPFSYKSSATSPGQSTYSQLRISGIGGTTVSAVDLVTSGSAGLSGSISIPAMTYVAGIGGNWTNGYAGPIHTVTFAPAQVQVYDCSVI